ncbi:hypothetical protein AcW2_001085 [Taiwanofungus camphoratus]|nr:hypothetical protein AcW2_001085 [Antrodia cinnamomea]
MVSRAHILDNLLNTALGSLRSTKIIMDSSISPSSMSSMPMSTSSSGGSMMMMGGMTPYLHFTGGDNLLFKAWTPSSHGAIAGACIGLVVLAIFERFIGALRGLCQMYWRRRALAITSKTVPLASSISSTPSQEKSQTDIEEVNVNTLADRLPADGSVSVQRLRRTIAPFILAHDLPRGALYAFQAFLAYTLMLAVMTFQAAFIISILVGLGIGEVAFGRLGNAESHTLH